MPESIRAFIDCLSKERLAEDIDFLWEASELLYQQLIDLEAEEAICAENYERTADSRRVLAVIYKGCLNPQNILGFLIQPNLRFIK